MSFSHTHFFFISDNIYFSKFYFSIASYNHSGFREIIYFIIYGNYIKKRKIVQISICQYTSRISEYAIKGRAYKSFKQYVLFEYAARGISVLEGFSYGNLCYILSVVREDDVKEAIAWKSKEQVKSTEVFIADIQHDLEYDNHIKELFVKYPDKS